MIETRPLILPEEKEQPPIPKAERIIRNAAKCNRCGDIIESKYTHDFVTCSCGALSVDGGKNYVRRCFHAEIGYTDLSEYAEEERMDDMYDAR